VIFGGCFFFCNNLFATAIRLNNNSVILVSYNLVSFLKSYALILELYLCLASLSLASFT
jgi:hypothetical protein